ncbi:MAG: M48 family metalloprotease [Alcanivoracaceae bacterium]|nr:M48 family metalloprotease [Alcanivoracaceae bacterium]
MKRVFLSAIIWLAGVLPAMANDLPDLGDPSVALLSADQEHRLGRAWLRQLRGTVPLLTDPLVQEYAEHLVYRLASHSDLEEPDLAIVVVNAREINAFAVPGGVIGLNAGLFLNAGTEDEVAAVVAHEIAHVSQHHFLRRYADAQRMNRAVLAAMLASLAVAIAGEADAGMAGLAATQAAAIQQQLAYSRHHEREADRVGMQTLQEAGMDPTAMPRFFEKMLREQSSLSNAPEFMLTHPVTESRISDSRARALQAPPHRLTASRYFQLIRARLLAGFYREPADAVNYFVHQDHGGATVIQHANAYGLAIAYTRNKQFRQALAVIERLQQAAPDEQWYRLARAETLLAMEDYERAIRELRAILEVMPGNYTASIILARTQLAAGAPGEAADLLTPLLEKRPWDASLWQLAADAWGKSERLAQAHHARAEVLFLHGSNDKAYDQMRYAMKLSKQNFARHSRLKARLREMEALAEEDF